MSTVEVKNAGFSYDPKKTPPVFSDVTFTGKGGEMIAVLGPNGAGKTTLLRCILGLLRLTEGECRLDGENIAEMNEKRLFRKLSYVPQRATVTSATVLETVLFGLSEEIGPFGVPKETHVSRARATLALLGITDLSEKRCDALSGGELQMVMIARALVKEPSVMILDEPESGLDFRNQLTVLSTLRRLADAGVLCIFNTHYPEHALQFSDKALILSDRGAVFGKTDDVVTEESIGRAFRVRAVIGEIPFEDTAVKSVVPIALSDDKEEK